MKPSRLAALLLVLTSFPSLARAQVTCGPAGSDFTVPGGVNVLNGYYPGPAMSGVVTVPAGATSIPIDTAAARGAVTVAAGDLLLVIQMQGATINGGDQNAVGGPYGDGAGGDDRMGALAGATFLAGRYELAVAAGPAGATIPLRAPLTNAYVHSSTVVDNGDGTGSGFRRYQVVVVRQYRGLTVPAGATIGALPWDGRSGGIVALDVSGTLRLNGTIDVSGLGFRGGSPVIPTMADMPQPAVKGESLAGPTARMYGLPVTTAPVLTVYTGATGLFGGDNGRGGPANGGGCPTAGGGGLGTFNDSGGGGGGGGGDGGNGMIGPAGSTATTRPRGGAGYNDPTRLFLGGGGGSGSVDDPVGVNGVSGQPGGGIIYVRATSVLGTGSMIADGRSGITNLTTEGGGGGGGGGSIFVYSNGTTIPVTLRARGGNGTSTLTADDAGGGGGGGGHVVVATPGGMATVTVDVAGGAGGTSPNRPAAGGGTGGFQQVAAPPMGTMCPSFAVCGDGMPEAPESCDDGNTASGDGCSATCRREITITVPPDGGVTNDATPTISGTADPGAMVSVVVGGSTLTTTADGAGNWSVTVTTALPEGSSTATATATATDGGTSMDSATFTVDTTTSVAITDPTSGEVTGPQPVISGTGEPGATITVTIDGTPIGTTTVDAGGTWSLPVPTPLSGGMHTAGASATDAAGNTATATPVGFLVDDATMVAILVPDEGSTTMDSTPDLSGTGEPGATIEVVLTGPGGAMVTVSTTVAADGTWSVTATGGLANGMWTAVATATDGFGNVATDMQSFTVDASVSITIGSPADGSTTSDTTPTISGTGTPGATVTVTVDGTAVGTATVAADGTWSVTVTTELAEGSHTATATATAGGMMATATNSFTVAESGTFVELRQPGDAGPIGDSTPELSGTGEPGASVEVTIDGTVVGTVTVDAAGNWTLQLDTALSDGPHSVSVTATDGEGNTASDTGSFTVDSAVPALEIDSPADGATTGPTPTITGRTEPNASVTVIVDGVILGVARADADGFWSIPVASPLADGDHTVEATTTSAAGRTANDRHDFTVDGSAPAVDVTTPANGEHTSDSTPTISGTAEPGASVQVFVGGELVGTVTAAADGSWSVDVTDPLADGDHTVRAVARDAGGNVATDSGAFVVDTRTSVVIERPADGTSTGLRPVYVGTAEPGASVEVSVDGTVIGTVVAADDGTWTLPQPADLSAGVHTVEAVATDEVGNSATDSSDFTVDPTILDSDGDGLIDPVECPTPGSCPDTDGDGMTDELDPDDDGDGVPTAVECMTPGACPDTDGDGTPDHLDPDDDGDGIPTRDERPGDVSVDTDGDGMPDYLDPDDDGDGLPTMEECMVAGSCRDTDGDDTPDYLDPDDDDDGILTSRERADGMMFGDDVDDDGTDNWLDTDSDGDGTGDMLEGLRDSDGMGPPDYLDPNFPRDLDAGVPDGGVVDGSVADGSVLDTGPTVGGLSGGACGCRVAPRARPIGLLALVVVLGLALVRRRR